LKKLREKLLERCKGYCELCGGSLGDNWALHHRKLKSRGGKDEIANIVALHHKCHNLGTDSVHLNPARAKETGFMVSSWDDPVLIWILYYDGFKVYLKNDGTIERAKECQENQR